MTSIIGKQGLTGLISPFDNTRDTRFFFESKVHAEALSRLLYIASDKTMGMGMLTGEIGAGKTLTRTVFANHLPSESYRVVAIENGLLEFDDLLLEIISQLKGERASSQQFPDRYSRLAEYKRLLINEIAQIGKHLIVIIDEAQQLSDYDLDALKGLSNISSERLNYATLILVGQPELRERIRTYPQLDQRIALRYHINPMSPADVTSYLLHRLRRAGLRGKAPFTKDAAELIARVSGGIPRAINRISKLSLEYCEGESLDQVTKSIVELIVNDLVDQSGAASAEQLFG